MSGVRGDIFAHSTWRRHTITTLKNRGLIRGAENDVAVKCFFDMELCILARVAESASTGKVLPKFEKMELDVAEPGTYYALEKQSTSKKAVVNTTAIHHQIGDLGFDAEKPSDYGLGEELPTAAPAARHGRDCIAMGRGPVSDE